MNIVEPVVPESTVDHVSVLHRASDPLNQEFKLHIAME